MPKNVPTPEPTPTPPTLPVLREDVGREPGFATADEPSGLITPRGRRMGHKPGGFPANAWSTKMLFGARRGLQHSAMGLKAFVDHPRDQKTTQSCVGQALARIVHLRACQQLADLGTARHADFPSALALYKLALQMVAGGDRKLVDEGSYPGKALLAAAKYGVVKESVYPFTDSPDLVTEPLPLDVFKEAHAALFQGFYRIDSEGTDLVLDCKQALSRGFPFMMAVQVDDAFENCVDETPIGPPKGHIHGGHMIPVLGYEGDKFLILNSWSNFGFDSFAWLTAEAVAVASDHAVAQVAPILEGM